jgi:hypothetical protein
MKRLSILGLIGGWIVAMTPGCAGPRPFLLQGDANSAEVGYGGDPATTAEVARQHCARYERVARLSQTQENVAYYLCVRP